MANVIDNKVVQFDLDNRNFEKNADKSIKTIDKLQDSLNFDNATKSLNNLTAASRGINFDALADSVETVKAKFSAWDVVAMNVIGRITNKVIDMTTQFVKSVSGIEMVKNGFNKYEEKVTAVQTIMSATAETWKKSADALGFEGTQMEFVNEQLEKLNWFSDETSFSFTDMTSNIGKFTSSGVELNKAVTAMEGISVWAAKSGQNAQSASRAYYNLAQAISVGSVKLIDWKSIENANMATMEFKQTAIDTAVQLKYLKKAGDGLYKTTSGSIVSVENFNEALSDGWFSSEVLMATLDKYGKAATKLSEISDEYNVTATSFLYNMDKWSKGEKDITQVARTLNMSVDDLLPLFEELNSEEYKLGLSAFKAAQEAKTFTEAIEATKDAVSTGWMKTFEIIFGNYEEAKVLWTEMANRLWDVFAAGGETRNEILGLWKEAGGQKALVESFWDLWDAVSEFADVIKEAFGEIFNTDVMYAAGKLDAFTSKIKNFVSTLHMSDETADKFKRTFKGLFAAVDILKDALQVITIPLKNVIGYLAKGSGVVLDYAASIGDWIVALRDMLKQSKFFESVGESISDAIFKIIDEIRYFKDLVVGAFDNTKTGLENAVLIITTILSYFVESIGYLFTKLTGIDVSDYIKTITDSIKKFGDKVIEFSKTLNFDKVINKVKDFVKKIKDEFKKFGKVDTSGIEQLGEKVKTSFHPLLFVADLVKFVFGGIYAVLKMLSPVFKAIGTVLKSAFSEIAEGLGGLVNNFSFEKVEELVQTGVFATIGLAIFNFAKNLKEGAKMFSGIKDTFEKFGGILDVVKDGLTAWQNNLKSNILLKLAFAIGIITLSLIALTSIETSKLTSAMSIITAEFVELMGSMKLLNTMDFKGMSMAGTTLIKLSVAILIMALACKALAGLSLTEVVQGVAGIGTLSFILVQVAKSLSSNVKHMIKGAGSMILFAIAIRLLVKPVKELGDMPWEEMIKGLLGVSALLFAISKFMSAKMKGSVKAGLAMILMATAVTILAKAVKSFATMDWVEMVKGLSAFALVLFGMSKFMQAISGVKKMVSAGVGMVLMAASMLIFAKAIETMGNLKIEVIGKGLLAMAGILTEVALAMNFLPKGMITKALGLVLVGAALNILATALTTLGNLQWEQIGKGLLALGVALLEITLALNFMKGTVGAALSMLIFAAALNILTPCLKTLGNMSWESMAKAGLVLAGLFAIFGGAGYLLGPVVPIMLALAGAVLLLGVGLTSLGVGITLISAGLASLSGSVLVGVEALIVIIKSIIKLIPDVIKAIGEGLFDILVMVFDRGEELIKSIGKFVVSLVETLLDALEKLTPKVVKFLTKTLVYLVKAALVSLKKIIPDILDFLVYLVDQLAIYLPALTNSLIDLFIAQVLTIGERIPDLILVGIGFMIQLINGLAKGIEDNAGLLAEAFTNLISSAFTAILVFFGFDKDEAKKMVDTGLNLVKSIVKGIISIGDGILNAFLEAFATGIEYVKLLADKFIQFGKDIVQGLIDGIKALKEKAKTGMHNLSMEMADAFAGPMLIHSPSKLFEKYGEYIDMGLINGINGLSKDVMKSSSSLANSMINSVKSPLDDFNSSFEDLYSPKLVPVVDLNSIDAGYKNMKNVISDSALDITNFNQRALNTNLSAKFSTAGLDTLDTDIVGAIKELQNDTQMLGTYISGLQISLDGKAVVGGIAPMMNVKLGQYLKYSGRGN